MIESQSFVFVVDDDASVRAAVEDLLRSVGLAIQNLRLDPGIPAKQTARCARMPRARTFRMPGQSGLEFQRTLTNTGIHLPIIFISGHGDIPMSVRAIKSGAIEFLTKPLHEQELLDAIQGGIERDRARRESVKAMSEFQERFEFTDGTRT